MLRNADNELICDSKCANSVNNLFSNCFSSVLPTDLPENTSVTYLPMYPMLTDTDGVAKVSRT